MAVDLPVERERKPPLALAASALRAGALAGGIAILLIILGLQAAMWALAIGPLSVGDLVLAVLVAWMAARCARGAGTAFGRALVGAVAGVTAAVIYAAFATLANSVNLKEVLDNVGRDAAPALFWHRSAEFAWLVAVAGGLVLGAAGALASYLPARTVRRAASVSARVGAVPYLNMVLAILAAVALIAAPPFIGPFWDQTLGSIGIYVLMGLGLNIVVGFAGLLDLGYVAFFAIGAYTYAFLASPKYGLHLPFLLALPAGMAMACLFGVLLGIPVLRMRGDYLAIVTLGFGEIIRILMNNLTTLTGGPQGVLQIESPSLFGLSATRPLHYYYLILAGCLLVGWVSYQLNRSRIGRAWVAMREDEDVAAASGVNIVRFRLLAFATGAAFAGMGGVIFASRQHAIFPSDFVMLVSINVLCLIIIGGLGSIPGVIAGSVILIGLPEVLRQFADFRLLLFGALLVLMMVARPEGLIPSRRTRLELEEAGQGFGRPPAVEEPAQVAEVRE